MHKGGRTVMIPLFDGEALIKQNYEQWLTWQDEGTQMKAFGNAGVPGVACGQEPGGVHRARISPL